MEDFNLVFVRTQKVGALWRHIFRFHFCAAFPAATDLQSHCVTKGIGTANAVNDALQ